MTVVHVSDPRDLARLIREDQERLRADVEQGIVEAAHIGQRIVRSVVPVDQGGLRRETVVEDHPEPGVVSQIVERTPYAAAVEVGTRPFTPPFEAILAWAKRQAPNMGLTSEAEIKRVAGAVWTSIRRKGIKAKWSTRDSLPKLRAVLARTVSRAVREHKPAGAR